jgi:hypothetical protein
MFLIDFSKEVTEEQRKEAKRSKNIFTEDNTFDRLIIVKLRMVISLNNVNNKCDTNFTSII